MICRGSERWWLDYVPRCMRSWPWLRRYFWQQHELDAVRELAENWRKLFGEHDTKETP